MELEATDEHGRTLTARAAAASRMILPAPTSICTNTLVAWTIDGEELVGEDQDVWPIDEWRRAGTAPPAGID